MPVFSLLLSAEIQRILSLNYEKIKAQLNSFGPANKIVKAYNFSLVDETKPFQIDTFIDMIR